ncbi:MAG: aspartyl/glutamyl-tRNA amidotransferase subunit B [Candidatus Firestonebacteria bacterium RIFOXYC2_FULL_39_67]|nr:MAG: aspartyl/glutamyl-tRNA amidotransferase subunit B [Candidatus Firestonebacteria bacterium RIFOXYD2_FULL_39_29]OGF56584.1 MAG: aspartyl/glutamyl-tRNA amidotransferase subunit B [Candidatus Firestonebacteria bacterium RIFOXYC2_FULL_39_67]
MSKYETIIGLEVHVQLKTATKLFCGCSTKFGAEANTQTCPVCEGLPGVLPVLNKKAVEFAVRTGLALNFEINEYAKFDRKNYFYPDLPKGYQVSQKDQPFCEHGKLEISVNGVKKVIGITRAHLEEDAGKLIHAGASGQIGDAEISLVDLNRTCVPLLEIVSEPDIRSPEEAYEYLSTLKSILQYIGVSDCDMEKGSLRCDANVSLRPFGQKEFNPKVEIKNLNSFKNVKDALEYEMARQTECLDAGEKTFQETRLFTADKGTTTPMRSKEESNDYRYFPEPDLVLNHITCEMIEEIRKTLVELPAARHERFVTAYGLPEYDAGVLTASKAFADYFETCAGMNKNYKALSNLVMGDLMGFLKAANLDITESPVKPENLVKLVKLIDDNVVSSKIAKVVFEDMFKDGADPEIVVKQKGLVQITDEGSISSIVDKVLLENPAIVAEYKSGKDKVIGNLVGKVMKESAGKANPGLVNKILKEKLSK